MIPSRLKTLASALAAGWLVLCAPVAAQSLEQKAGQMIIVGFAGDSTGDKGVVAARNEIAAGLLGGVMFMKPNVSSLDAVRAMNDAFLLAAAKGGGPKPFITVDQEGGMVERLTREIGFHETPTATEVARGGPEKAFSTYLRMAADLGELGFNVNFGPVVDLNRNKNNPVIAKFGRSYGTEPAEVTSYARQFVAAHQRAGVLTSLKHFPGHGSSTTDSHEGFTDITKTWDKVELEPYRAFFAQGYTEFVMVGHLYHADYAGAGPVKLPASLSPEWITDVLRNQLKFKGVVISDDLEMGAVRDHFELRDRVIRAVNAGMDVLLFSNTARPRATLAAELRKILVDEANASPAFRGRIEQSHKRILVMKGEPMSEADLKASPISGRVLMSD